MITPEQARKKVEEHSTIEGQQFEELKEKIENNITEAAENGRSSCSIIDKNLQAAKQFLLELGYECEINDGRGEVSWLEVKW